jgi:hypothetical protein
MIAETTVYILPFMLEVLAVDEFQDKEYVLFGFQVIIDTVLRSNLSIQSMRSSLGVYDGILKGLELYLGLLKHPKKEVRIEICALLTRLQIEASRIIEKLKTHYEQETSVEVRVAIIENVVNIPISTLLYDDSHEFRKFIMSSTQLLKT